eukprot:COSAG01_NODE_66585_length_269_cov_1.505882_1_plen_48_part_01
MYASQTRANTRACVVVRAWRGGGAAAAGPPMPARYELGSYTSCGGAAA